MTDSATTAGPTCRNSRWQRFIDKLAGGPPDPEKIAAAKRKMWIVRHWLSVFASFLLLLMIVVPEIVLYLNGPPAPEAMQTLNVRIIRTHELEPHLWVELPDGRQRGVRWPVRLATQKGGFRSNAWSDEERLGLPGCHAVIKGAPVWWVPDDLFNVWELDCQERGIRIGIDKVTKQYGISVSGWWIAASLGLFGLFFIVAIYLHEKRGAL